MTDMDLAELQKRLDIASDNRYTVRREWLIGLTESEREEAMRLRKRYHQRLIVFLAMMGDPVADVLRTIEFQDDDFICNFEVGVLDHFRWSRGENYYEECQIHEANVALDEYLKEQGVNMYEFIYKLHKDD